MNKGIRWMKGYIQVIISGNYIEIFLNMAVKRDLHIWDFHMVSEKKAEFFITLSDFFRLKPILRKTYTRIHVKERRGLPFFFNQFSKRKGLAVGFFLFFILVYVMSSIIWSIEIVGNQTIKEEEVHQAIEEIGIHTGMFQFQLPDYKVIQDHLLFKLENTVWIGVNQKGTRLYITVVEKVTPKIKPLASPRHIISNKDAVIYKILAENGLPLVKVNDRVKKGDILISGIMGNEKNNQIVVAEGTVEGIVWYESTVTLPINQKWKEYTGNVIQRKYLIIGSRMIRMEGEKEIPYAHFNKDYRKKNISWKNIQLPIGFLNEKILEYEENKRKLTQSEVIQLALELTKKDLFSKIDTNSRLLNEKILRTSVENDKVTVKILFEVIEDIKSTEPIIQGE